MCHFFVIIFIFISKDTQNLKYRRIVIHRGTLLLSRVRGMSESTMQISLTKKWFIC